MIDLREERQQPEAERSYQAALKIDPTLKEAQEGLDRVSK
jgi:hypothetical protein